jgi:CRISPR-associated endonuclease/helicase Cas3
LDKDITCQCPLLRPIASAIGHVKTLEYKEFDYINRYRNLLFDNLERMSKTVSLDRKIFSITAQTGLGKTLSSINFALNLRERILKHMGYTPRIIYVAPFITILDQNVKVFQNVFGSNIQSSILLMHHHLSPLNYIRNVVDEQKSESYYSLFISWSMSIITNLQDKSMGVWQLMWPNLF